MAKASAATKAQEMASIWAPECTMPAKAQGRKLSVSLPDV
jgi:hypothetical protein